MYTRSYHSITLLVYCCFELFLIWLLFGNSKFVLIQWTSFREQDIELRQKSWLSQLMLVLMATQNSLVRGAFSCFFIADTLTPLLISCLHRQHKEPKAQSRPESDNISVTWIKTSLANLNFFAKTCQSANYQGKLPTLPTSIGHPKCWQQQTPSRIPL